MKSFSLNPYLVVIIGVISVSLSAIFVKFAEAPSGVTAFYRLFFSVIILLPFFIRKGIKELKKITGVDWLLTLSAGVFLAFHFILWFESLNYTSVASSTVLVTMQPLFAFVGTALIFGESFSIGKIISGIISIGGSVLISWGDFMVSGMALWGDILALIACALATAYLLFGQALRKRLSLITYTFTVYSIGTLVLLVYVLVVGEPLVGYSRTSWIYFLLLAILPTLLGHSLFNWAIKWVSTSFISIAILFEPVGATILAILLLNEKVSLVQITGAILVLAGICFFMIGQSRQKVPISIKE